MLDYDTAIELMKKYGYSSTTSHPYIYQNGNTLGICYSYDDEDYGQLERIKIFEDLESFESFLKQLEWVKNNGRNFHVRMILDNYESINPKTLFLRNEKLLMDGEMFDIESYDYREMQREQMDDVSKIIYEAGDLLLVYDEIKGRQLQYLNSIVKLKNTLREKYYELQKEVDTYNKYKVERHLTLLSDVTDIGINDSLEITVKDKYNLYVVQLPSLEEASDFLREVWELNRNLELNVKYYEAQKDENDARNELKVVEKKLELMRKLNEDLRPLFGIDLMSRFRKINKQCALESNSMSNSIIQDNINRTSRKYDVFDELDLLYTSDYLREAIQNTNYADLAIKYSKNSNKELLRSFRIPPNEVAASLSLQYRDKLNVSEQSIMVLYNNHKYRKLCNAILSIDDFDTLPVKKVISKISGIKGYSKIKSECYDIVKKRIDDPLNINIKNSIFNGYDFSTYETFIASLIRELSKLRNIKNKMVLNGDLNMYLVVNKPEDINSKKVVMVTNDLNSLLVETKASKDMIGITLLKKHTPVLYSPYYLDMGDIYSKEPSLQMYIKEMINFELLVVISDIIINIDPVKTDVVRYYSEPITVENVSVVDDIKVNYKTTFCKFAFTNGLGEVIPELPDVSNVALQTGNTVVNSEAVALSGVIESGMNPQNNPVVAQSVDIAAVPSVVPEVVNSSNVVSAESTNVDLVNTVSQENLVNQDGQSEVVVEAPINPVAPNEEANVNVQKVEEPVTEINSENKEVSSLEVNVNKEVVEENKSILPVTEDVNKIDEKDDLSQNKDEEKTDENVEVKKVEDVDSDDERHDEVHLINEPVDNSVESEKKESINESSKNVESNEPKLPENVKLQDEVVISQKAEDDNKKVEVEKEKITSEIDSTIKKVSNVGIKPQGNVIQKPINKQIVVKTSNNITVKPVTNQNIVKSNPVNHNLANQNTEKQNLVNSSSSQPVNRVVPVQNQIPNKVVKPMPQPVKKEVKVVGSIGKPVQKVVVNKQPGMVVKKNEK